MWAWKAVGWRCNKASLFAWQTAQLTASTPLTGVWQAAQFSFSAACAEESSPGLASRCQVEARRSEDQRHTVPVSTASISKTPMIHLFDGNLIPANLFTPGYDLFQPLGQSLG
jgi:hypothetical protein